jgi:hypothetical protein
MKKRKNKAIISHKQNHNYDKLSISKKTLEMLQINNDKNLDIQKLVEKQLMEKIENDEMNKLGFYEIVPDKFDLFPSPKKSPFKSIHNASDSYLMGLNKFHKTKKYTSLESNMRKALKKKTGNKLLLNEM